MYDWLLTISRLPDDLLTPDLKHYVTGKQLYIDKVEVADVSSFYLKQRTTYWRLVCACWGRGEMYVTVPLPWEGGATWQHYRQL